MSIEAVPIGPSVILGTEVTNSSPRASAYYSGPVDFFLAPDPYELLGALTASHTHDLEVKKKASALTRIDPFPLVRIDPHAKHDLKLRTDSASAIANLGAPPRLAVSSCKVLGPIHPSFTAKRSRITEHAANENKERIVNVLIAKEISLFEISVGARQTAIVSVRLRRDSRPKMTRLRLLKIGRPCARRPCPGRRADRPPKCGPRRRPGFRDSVDFRVVHSSRAKAGQFSRALKGQSASGMGRGIEDTQGCSVRAYWHALS